MVIKLKPDPKMISKQTLADFKIFEGFVVIKHKKMIEVMPPLSKNAVWLGFQTSANHVSPVRIEIWPLFIL